VEVPILFIHGKYSSLNLAKQVTAKKRRSLGLRKEREGMEFVT
jgi:hypothetical protein